MSHRSSAVPQCEPTSTQEPIHLLFPDRSTVCGLKHAPGRAFFWAAWPAKDTTHSICPECWAYAFGPLFQPKKGEVA
jgi:hypothetical protein